MAQFIMTHILAQSQKASCQRTASSHGKSEQVLAGLVFLTGRVVAADGPTQTSLELPFQAK